MIYKTRSGTGNVQERLFEGRERKITFAYMRSGSKIPGMGKGKERKREREGEREETCHLAVSLRRCIIATDLRSQPDARTRVHRYSPTLFYIYTPRALIIHGIFNARGERQTTCPGGKSLVLTFLPPPPPISEPIYINITSEIATFIRKVSTVIRK